MAKQTDYRQTNASKRPESPTGASDKAQYQQDLSAIRTMMERSSRFISLSGLSGVAAGLTALLGGGYAYFLVNEAGRDYLTHTSLSYSGDLMTRLILLALIVLVLALGLATYFTVRKSKKAALSIWTTATKQLLSALFVPLVIGGICCIALIYHGHIELVAPATLIFYGLSLLNASKYTYTEIYYLGILEAALGLMSSFLVGYGLIFWMLGFGVLHIVYGIVMQRKYR
ncbi:hypothetical protein SAMN05192529_12326 [Arachidicoccus rhizosphaerae]|uniref:Uncharacterized protein n=1 Tax=Arachidicoccus rhizosphaerae TaxID=551991 RepID=A0A1H4BPD9_9BACT|nr:hypothetical protein [Arachidicoccus rhizosphaerae]SEA49937.1 hypothetical protein SAMN05192529_12326 [Arachidicoccus rhizosphaerae]